MGTEELYSKVIRNAIREYGGDEYSLSHYVLQDVVGNFFKNRLSEKELSELLDFDNFEKVVSKIKGIRKAGRHPNIDIPMWQLELKYRNMEEDLEDEQK